MRYVSPEGRLVGPAAAFDTTPSLWDRMRDSMGGGRFMSAVLVLLMTITVARSTATVNWVDGIDIVTWVALGGAVLMGALALLPVREPIALTFGLLVSPFAAFLAAWPQIHIKHPTDAINAQLPGVWWERINSGAVASDTSFYLILICLLLWITGAWLAWCVLRWRKPMLGLIPGAAAFATNVLNFPQDQNGYTLAMLVLTLALLLWTNYTGSLASAARASVKLTGDARWDFWESGLVAMAALIVLGIMLPPLSTADRTLDVETGIFSNWAQLQQRLSHPGFFNSGPSSGITGFSDDVKLGGNLQRTRDIVFTYTTNDFSGPRYFRGVNATQQRNGIWQYPGGEESLRKIVPKNDVFFYAENYEKLAVGKVNVKMLRPPVNDRDIVFYPGVMYKIDRVTSSTQLPNPAFGASEDTYSIDRLSSVQPATAAGAYAATVEYSTATAEELEGAGTDYPDWVGGAYSAMPSRGYRSPFVQQEIHDLAVSVVKAAGATNPYDQAHAIEAFLRDPTKFHYTLDAKTPRGTDPIEYFLFTSKKGYCEFFATAMGDMLRSLGIPARLVNGFGAGSYDNQTQQDIVRGEDAHTWVEVYFPKYGWIPFEPTADDQSLYQSIPRGATGATCFRDNGCDGTTSGGTTSSTPGVDPPGLIRGERNDPVGAVVIGGFRVSTVDATSLMKIVGGIVAIVLLVFVALSRYLRPRSVMGVWKRTLTLVNLAGARRRPGETPLELGRRLQRTFPEAAEPAGALANGFVVAAYAPPDVATTARPAVMEAWSSLRPMLLRRVLARLRPTRP
jgi:transglutaminase-like putative cysteine protease